MSSAISRLTTIIGAPRYIEKIIVPAQEFKLLTASNPYTSIMGSSAASRRPAPLALDDGKPITLAHAGALHAWLKKQKIAQLFATFAKMSQHGFFGDRVKFKKVSTVGAHSSKENELQFFSGKEGMQGAHLLPRVFLVNGLPLWHYVKPEQPMLMYNVRGLAAAVSVAPASINQADSLMESKGFPEQIARALEALANDPMGSEFDVGRVLEEIEKIPQLAWPSINEAMDLCTTRQLQEPFRIRKELLAVFGEVFEEVPVEENPEGWLKTYSDTLDSELR